MSQKQKDQLQTPMRQSGFFRALLLLLFLTMSVAIIANYQALRNTILSSSTNNLRQQALVQLDIYQQSYANTVSNYYNNSLNTIESLASSPDTLRDINTGQLSDLTSIFQHQRDFDKQFNTITAFPASGRLWTISTDSTSFNPNITTAQLNPTLRQAMNTHNPQITNAYKSSVGRYVIGFVAPVNDNTGNYKGSIIGNVSLGDLASRVNSLYSSSNFSSALVDSQGNILINKNKALAVIQNISKSEPIFKQLQTSHSTVSLNETNFNNQKVVAEGSSLPIDHAGKIYVISYMYNNDFSNYANALQKPINRLVSRFITFNIVFLVVVLGALFWLLIKRQP